MVDFELIQRALDEAVSDAEELYNRRKVEYAGYEKSGKVAAYADAMVEAQKARAEFNKLRRSMEWQPISMAPENLDVLTYAQTIYPWAIECKINGVWERTDPAPTHWMPLPPPPKGEE